MVKALDPLKKSGLVHSFMRGFLWIRGRDPYCAQKVDFPYESSRLRSEVLLGLARLADYEPVAVRFTLPLPFHYLEA